MTTPLAWVPRRMRRLGGVLTATTVLALSACDVPRDPEGTLQRIQNGVMRVGVIAHEPWVVVAGGEPTGVEPALIKEFAAGLNARIEWVRGAEPALMEALTVREVDLVIGGLTDSTPWSSQVALTAPYLTTRAVIGVRAGSPSVTGLEGLRVAVRVGDAVTADLEAEGAIPVAVSDRSRESGPVAALDWEVRDWGFDDTGIVLRSYHHVMAVAPGENAWLVRLERFLERQ